MLRSYLRAYPMGIHSKELMQLLKVKTEKDWNTFIKENLIVVGEDQRVKSRESIINMQSK